MRRNLLFALLIVLVSTGCGAIDSLQPFKNSQRAWEKLFVDGVRYLHEDKNEEAVKQFKLCLDIAEPDSLRQGFSLDRLARAYEHLGEFEVAIGYYKQALNVYDKLNSKLIPDRKRGLILKEKVASLTGLGRCYRRANQDQDAVKTLKQTEELANQFYSLGEIPAVDKLSSRDLLESQYLLGKIYEKNGLSERALQVFKGALVENKTRRSNADLLVAKVKKRYLVLLGKLNKKDDLNLSKAEQSEEAKNLDEALSVWTEHQVSGDTFASNSDWKKAEESYRLAFVSASRIDKFDDRALLSLGSLLKSLLKQKRFKDANQVIKKRKAMLALAKPSKNLDDLYEQIYLAYREQKRWRDIIEILKAQLKVRQAIRGKGNHYEVIILKRLGRNYLKTKDYIEAKLVMEQALDIAKLIYKKDSEKMLELKELHYRAVSHLKK